MTSGSVRLRNISSLQRLLSAGWASAHSECYYGTDIDDKNNLIATHHTVDEIAKIIGVNSLGYLSLEDVVKLADNTENGFCTACFGGGYPTPIPQDSNKDRFECKISEREKQESV